MPDNKELFQHYRSEIRHEMDLMMARLNALLTSQSFLIIAYAGSMAVFEKPRGNYIFILLPIFLSILGFILAFEGRRGINAARTALDQWQTNLEYLVENNSQLIVWMGNAEDIFGEARRAGKQFALQQPLIFMAAWVWLFALPFIITSSAK